MGEKESNASRLHQVDQNLIIDYFVTGRCDMKCPFCYGADVPVQYERSGNPKAKAMYQPTTETINVTEDDSLRPELSYEQSVDLLCKLALIGLKKLNIGGGEPLMRVDTPQIIEQAKKLGIKVYLSTNATFTRARYDLIKDNIEVLGLPLEGSTKEMNVAMGRAPYLRANFEKMLRHLEKNRPSHKVKVGTIVSKINFDDLSNIGRFLYRTSGIYKPDVWRIYQFEPVERGEDTKDQYQISDKDFTQAIDNLRLEFPDANISPRANSDHINAYFFISPDGMMQLVDNRHRSILDVAAADEKDILRTINSFDETIGKNEANREWLKTK